MKKAGAKTVNLGPHSPHTIKAINAEKEARALMNTRLRDKMIKISREHKKADHYLTTTIKDKSLLGQKLSKSREKALKKIAALKKQLAKNK